MINMMASISKKELSLSIVLVVLVGMLCNPFGIFMPTMWQMLVLALLVVLVGLFAGLVVYESVTDEREQSHRDRAGRVGYTAGLLVILLGIVVQSLKHVAVDGWLLAALVVLVIFKIAARVYNRRFH